MGNVKKTLLIAGIVCLVVGVFSAVTLCLDLFVYEYNMLSVIIDIVNFTISLGTGVFYLVIRTKKVKEICRLNMLFFWICILNILNNLIVWVVSFWVQIVVNNNTRFASVNRVKEQQTATEENNGDIEVKDYEIERIKESLTARLEEIEELKQRGMITEDEYIKLREEAINSYIK